MACPPADGRRCAVREQAVENCKTCHSRMAAKSRLLCSSMSLQPFPRNVVSASLQGVLDYEAGSDEPQTDTSAGAVPLSFDKVVNNKPCEAVQKLSNVVVAAKQACT